MAQNGNAGHLAVVAKRDGSLMLINHRSGETFPLNEDRKESLAGFMRQHYGERLAPQTVLTKDQVRELMYLILG